MIVGTPPTSRLVGPTSWKADAQRTPQMVHPDVLKRLRDLLFEPEMQGVGYSEFLNRACEEAETVIAAKRRFVREQTDEPKQVNRGSW